MKTISVCEAIGLVQDGCNIVTGLGAAEARSFMQSLHQSPAKDVSVTNCLPFGDYEFMKDAERFTVDGWFFGAGMRLLAENGNISFIPNHLHLAGIKRLAHVSPDIYVGGATPPDRNGYVSLSVSNTYERRMIDAAKIVILETNSNFPRTFGDVELHVSKIHYNIDTDYQLPEIPGGEIGEKDMAIGKLIANYVNDGDCIQLGIGGIPNATADALAKKKDLGVHTEMLTTGLMRLAKKGVVTGERKNKHRGKIVCTFILGTKELYDFCHDNPGVLVLDGNYVNDPANISKNDQQVSINTTLQIDLTGQCCSESIGHRQFSGTGGQADTAIGAQKSRNGKSFIALYSTANIKNEDGERVEISKIVPMLALGAVVSLSRNDVDFVVTEYGVAALRGTNVRERIRRLIAIAHPKYRENLGFEAKRMYYSM